MPHQVVHFEIPADDVDRARQFYSSLFGWETDATPGFPDYYTFDASDGEQMQGGAIQARQPGMSAPVNYISVESVAEKVDRIRELDGEILMDKSPVQGMGWLAIFRDTEGNMFGLWEMDPNAA
jgi:predicted enzyme related to lactoylglutathione lyase